jgi:hypothetical protein
VELSDALSAGPGAAVDLPAEGACRGPSLGPSRLAWGRGISSADTREAVLSQAAIRKARRLQGGQSSYPDSLIFRSAARRVRAARKCSACLKIVGLLRHQSPERLFVPVALAAKLDLWCTNAVSISMARHHASLGYLWADAYVPAAEQR